MRDGKQAMHFVVQAGLGNQQDQRDDDEGGKEVSLDDVLQAEHGQFVGVEVFNHRTAVGPYTYAVSCTHIQTHADMRKSRTKQITVYNQPQDLN